MSVYAVAQINITDRDRYSQYEAGFLQVFAKFRGELIAVDDDPEAIEGELTCNRCVILRFPDRDSLMAWHESSEYQELASHRWESSDSMITVIQALA